MNMNYMMAGAVSINPILLFLELLLILAWRVAGYIGGDLLLLPLLGTPWQRPPLPDPKHPYLNCRVGNDGE
jgi:thiosulfate dehydrogenase [quinone] large subunit